MDRSPADVVAAMTPEEKLWCLDGDSPTWVGLGYLGRGGYHFAPFPAARVDRLGVPGIAFADGPRGAVIGNSTCFPVAIARGATWDPDLEERIGAAIGAELRAQGANLTGAVCVNVLRHPAWGRAQETFGEDPHHVGEMGAALTRGLQQHVMACVKHFACNSMENARFSVDIEVDEVALHEVYLPHFRRIVDEGVASVMSAYNSVNGEWCGQNRALLTGILRNEWGFEGFVISDWILGLRDGPESLRAGLDIEMPYRMVRHQTLAAALEAGDVSWASVDTSVTRLVATLRRFEPVLSRVPGPDVVGCAEHRALAREAAARSVVLLRNDGVLPLPAPPAARLAVIGRLADSVNLGDGGSSDVWDLETTTVLSGLREAGFDCVFDDGADPAGAARAAAGADVAIVVVGYTSLDEGEYIGPTDPSLGYMFPPADEPDVVEAFERFVAERPEVSRPPRIADRAAGFSVGGDRDTLRLRPADVELIRAVAAAAPRTVVVIQAGSAVITSEWDREVSAVVLAWYGGCQAGPGLADVLSGAVNASGRLPFSVPADESDLPPFDRDATSFRYDRWHGWWHLARTGRPPAYPFGFGLSYTTFSLEGVSVEAGVGAIEINGSVVNTSERDGADMVQVYASLPDPDAPDRLVGFARVEVAAGSRTSFSILVGLDRLSARDPAAHAWRAPQGRYEFTVGRDAGDPESTRVQVEL